MYNKLENKVNEVYLGNTTTRNACKKYKISYYNMPIICQIEKKENADKRNQIQM